MEVFSGWLFAHIVYTWWHGCSSGLFAVPWEVALAGRGWQLWCPLPGWAQTLSGRTVFQVRRGHSLGSALGRRKQVTIVR